MSNKELENRMPRKRTEGNRDAQSSARTSLAHANTLQALGQAAQNTRTQTRHTPARHYSSGTGSPACASASEKTPVLRGAFAPSGPVRPPASNPYGIPPADKNNEDASAVFRVRLSFRGGPGIHCNAGAIRSQEGAHGSCIVINLCCMVGSSCMDHMDVI
jgi:hypothetical protein